MFAESNPLFLNDDVVPAQRCSRAPQDVHDEANSPRATLFVTLAALLRHEIRRPSSCKGTRPARVPIPRSSGLLARGCPSARSHAAAGGAHHEPHRTAATPFIQADSDEAESWRLGIPKMLCHGTHQPDRPLECPAGGRLPGRLSCETDPCNKTCDPTRRRTVLPRPTHGDPERPSLDSDSSTSRRSPGFAYRVEHHDRWACERRES